MTNPDTSREELRKGLLKHCRYEFRENGEPTGWGDFNLNGLIEEVEAYAKRKADGAKLNIVINALNLLNTEPVHTVEQALLKDKQYLEATLKQSREEAK